jgi:ubiquitin C-terminal hydrolase
VSAGGEEEEEGEEGWRTTRTRTKRAATKRMTRTRVPRRMQMISWRLTRSA